MLRSCGLSSVFALTMAGRPCAADIKGDYVEMGQLRRLHRPLLC